MKRTKLTIYLIGILIISTSTISLSVEIKADNWSTDIGSVWQLNLTKDEGDPVDVYIRINQIEGSEASGEEWYIYPTQILKYPNKSLSPERVISRDVLNSDIVPTASVVSKVYGGKVLYCYNKTKYKYYDQFIVDNATGIVVEQHKGGNVYTLVGWSFYEDEEFEFPIEW